MVVWMLGFVCSKQSLIVIVMLKFLLGRDVGFIYHVYFWICCVCVCVCIYIYIYIYIYI